MCQKFNQGSFVDNCFGEREEEEEEETSNINYSHTRHQISTYYKLHVLKINT